VTGRLAFVPPRYGTEALGGSEAVMREAAHGLARRGWDVEVLTTCARDHYTWRNEYEPGAATHDDGVVVRRFPVEGAQRGSTGSSGCPPCSITSSSSRIATTR